MINRYFLATGVVVLDRMTPVIEALFGGFNLQAAPPEAQSCSIAAIPTWTDVLARLRALSETLSLDPPEGALDTVPSALLLFAAHFCCVDDPALADLLEAHRFERDADIETLFTIAKRFDDGHGLKTVKFNASPYQGDLAHSAKHLANETLDLLSGLMPLVADQQERAALRLRLVTILVDAGETIER